MKRRHIGSIVCGLFIAAGLQIANPDMSTGRFLIAAAVIVIGTMIEDMIKS